MELTKEIEEEIKELEHFLGLAFLDFEDYNITYEFEIKSFEEKSYIKKYNKYYYMMTIILKFNGGLDAFGDLDRNAIRDTFNNCIEKFNVLSDIKIDFSDNDLYFNNRGIIVTDEFIEFDSLISPDRSKWKRKKVWKKS